MPVAGIGLIVLGALMLLRTLNLFDFPVGTTGEDRPSRTTNISGSWSGAPRKRVAGCR